MSSDWKSYRVSPWRLYCPWLAFGPMIALMAAIAIISAQDRGFGIVFAAFFAGAAWLTQWAISRGRLEVSTWGIRIRQGRFELGAPWSNVVSIRMDRGREGFITETPIEGPGAERLAAAREITYGFTRPRDTKALELLAQRRFIPAEAFGSRLRQGSLRAEIERLAPHLSKSFETLSAQPPGPDR